MKNWTWIGTDAHTPDEEWRTRLARLRAAGIDAILPEVFNNQRAYWESAHLPTGGAWLERLIPLAHEAGLEVHAWIHVMTCNVPEVMREHRDWYDVNGRGESAVDKPAYVGYYRFLCPSQPGVHEFLRRRLRELAAIPGLDGIHLDYIRFPDVILASALQPQYGIVQDREYPEYDYCYCDACCAGFAERHGADPRRLADPAASAEWRQYRCDGITRLVNEVLAPIGRGAGKQMTAAVFPNWQHVRQAWHEWQLDAVLPMLYHSFYQEGTDWVGAQCAAGVGRMAAAGVAKPLYSGLFVPALTPAQLGEAIRASRAGGADGISLFALASMSDAHWAAFTAAVAGRSSSR